MTFVSIVWYCLIGLILLSIRDLTWRWRVRKAYERFGIDRVAASVAYEQNCAGIFFARALQSYLQKRAQTYADRLESLSDGEWSPRLAPSFRVLATQSPTRSYGRDRPFTVTRISYGGPADARAMPRNVRDVLAAWNADCACARRWLSRLARPDVVPIRIATVHFG